MVGRARERRRPLSGAREDILSRIRQLAGGSAQTRARDYDAIPRTYVQNGTRDEAQRVELFFGRLRDYDSAVYTCRLSEIASSIGQILGARQLRRLLIPTAFLPEWLPAGLEFVSDNALTNLGMDSADGVLTGCALAIASTGTIVLRHSAEDGRRALTLIPDYHLCVVFENQIVETVPEGIRAMSPFSTAPITTISGPSATSDIEMTRIKGVHGPRTLDVLLVRTSNV